MATETCAGCGANPPQGQQVHPMVAVMNANDKAPDREPVEKSPDGTWVAVPLCDLCWKDPAHQQPYLKAHYYYRNQARTAVRLAGSDTIG